MSDKMLVIVWSLAVVAFFSLIGSGCYLYPKYEVYQQRLAGQAELERAQFNRRIEVEEAQAKMDAAQLLADAELIRAGGVAKANEVIGNSLKGNESYLRYLWIQGLQDGSSEVIYIPTEANLPILEAARKMEMGHGRQEQD